MTDLNNILNAKPRNNRRLITMQTKSRIRRQSTTIMQKETPNHSIRLSLRSLPTTHTPNKRLNQIQNLIRILPLNLPNKQITRRNKLPTRLTTQPTQKNIKITQMTTTRMIIPQTTQPKTHRIRRNLTNRPNTNRSETHKTLPLLEKILTKRYKTISWSLDEEITR